ncbi:NAD-dependent epimerase/dehydratase family protein [Neotamlana laminarinivorans]|uniref:NAD-dependent epimerase/dehydratase family protein n=1 Tax=Neotamlana laminarinivorans TaxID=2883124 RepID=A0A9X1L4L9_9FLAO|nr:NAD-dependent epimerase/dehydratase family protein [Tamlana laminarinivorans]MCB4798461.1 NAD-dependent epimerase/dehydratase family protein [Tamlana laminarinivorans]
MILVTGGTGLVGAHLLFKLVNENKNVRAIYRNKNKFKNTKAVFSCYTDNVDAVFNKIEWVEANILDIPALTEAYKNVKFVYHCAAFVSFEPNKYYALKKSNIEGTSNMVNLALANNIEKFCYVSSIATLGDELKNKKITEDSIYNPEADNSVYAITKYGGEMEVWRATQEGLNAVIVNSGLVIGPGIWHYGTGSFFKRAKKGISYYTSGTVGIVAVTDVVSVMIKLMESKISKERYILVAENWTYKNFLITLAKAVQAKPPKKVAKPWLLNMLWRLDWLLTKFTGKRRQLTKHLVQSLTTETFYSSNKIKKALNYEFKAINETITSVGNAYVKD